MNYNLEIYFLLFMTYSILGWAMESIKMIFNKNVGHFVNRGFLLGPYLPIYGFGVVAIQLLLGKYKNDMPALFWLSMITCGILEYFTSYIMEKLFDARWWDYSSRKFNINGRICLETLLPFGIAGVITVCFTNPFFISIFDKLPNLILHIISIGLLIIVAVDCLVTCYILSGLKTAEADLSADDDTENISNYLQEQAETMAMQLESDIRKKKRKRRIKRQRKMLHLKLRINKKISNNYKETLRKANALKEKISSDLEKVKHSNRDYTKELKEAFAKKSYLHKRLINAFPTFEYKHKKK